MAFLTDRNGDKWDIRLTIGDAREVLACMGLDLLEITPDGGFPAIVSDANRCGDLIFHLLENQRNYRGTSVRKLAKAFRGHYAAVVKSLQLAYTEFMPLPKPEDSKTESTDASQSDWWDIVHQAEATVGFRCDHMSLRQLLSTQHTIELARWRHTATVCAMTLNAQRRFVRRPLTADDLLRSKDEQDEIVTGKWMQAAFGVKVNGH